MLQIALLVIISVAGASAQGDSYCQFIRQKDCTKDPMDKVCGTNNITYRNRCEYAKVYCGDKTVHLQNSGPCRNEASTAAPSAATIVASTAAPVVTTPTVVKTTAPVVTLPPTTPKPINGSVVAQDIFCLDLIYINCPVGGSRVCGSDGKYYENACEFDKERCFHRELQTSNSGCV